MCLPRRSPPGPAVFGAVGLHALLLLALVWARGGPQLGEGGLAPEDPALPRKVMVVRQITAAPAPQDASDLPATLPGAAGDARSVSQADADPTAPQRRIPKQMGAELPPALSGAERARQAEEQREIEEIARARQAFVGFPQDAYLPASSLTRRPGIQDVINLPWPEGQGIPDGVLFRGWFKLFIDEDGVVRRLQWEGGNLPAPMQRITTDAFRNARFTAGELSGRRVKAWVRIEAEFDGRGVLNTRTLRD